MLLGGRWQLRISDTQREQTEQDEAGYLFWAQ